MNFQLRHSYLMILRNQMIVKRNAERKETVDIDVLTTEGCLINGEENQV